MQGNNAEKRGNIKDWWGKRPLSGINHRSGRMKVWKKQLHKIERAESVKEIKKAITQIENNWEEEKIQDEFIHQITYDFDRE